MNDSGVRETILHSVRDAARVSDWWRERQGNRTEPQAGISMPFVVTEREELVRGDMK